MTERDIPAVAALFTRAYPEHRWASQADCASYIREMLFHNPWRDLDLPSWVAEEDGRISACYGVMPRPMLFRGRLIRVAVGCQFMVDPDKRRSLTALELAKACMTGPQDLTLADGASEQVRHAWLAIGGSVPLLYGLHWTRPLRPARFLLSVIEERATLPPFLVRAARPLGALADTLIARLQPNRFQKKAGEFTQDLIDAETIRAHLPDVLRGYALRPMYEAKPLAWLLEEAARKAHQGQLRAFAVRDHRRKLIGWYLYYLRVGEVSEVLQIAALNGSASPVIDRLLADAWQQGAAAVRGRLDPRHAQDLSKRHCWLRTDGTWTLVHSRHPEIIAAIQQGDAFLSRLDGEWWLRFLGNGDSTRNAPHAWTGVRNAVPSAASSHAWKQS